jgi:hypothetical protein
MGCKSNIMRNLQFKKLKTLSGWLALAASWLLPTILNAATYYSRGTGLWTNPASWSTVTYGDPTNTGTYPQVGDNAFIGNGHLITFNSNVTLANLTIGQGASGSLEFGNLAIYWLTLSGNLTVNAGASLVYNANSSITHQVFLQGSLINDGTIDFYRDANDLVNLTFNGATSGTISGAGLWDLNTVTLNKTTLTSYSIDVQSNAFENAIRTLSLTYGTYIHNNAGTYNMNGAGGTDFTIPSNVIIEIPEGRINFSSLSNSLILQGRLTINGGDVFVGTTNGSEGIRTDQSLTTVIPTLNISDGSLTVYGGITFRNTPSSSFNEPFAYTQSGGTVLLNSGSTGTSREVFYVTDRANSAFSMSAGTMIIQKRNTFGSSVCDFTVCGGTGVVTSTGGTIQFGNLLTPNNSFFTFRPYASVTLPNIKITGATNSNNLLAPNANATSNYRFLSLYIEAGTRFDNRSISGLTANSKTMSLRGNFDGQTAFYCDGTFLARTGTVLLEGNVRQDIAGSTRVRFWSMTINNTSAAGVYTMQNLVIDSYLNMTQGIVYSTYGAMIHASESGNANVGNATSYVIGPFNQVYKQTSPAAGYFPVGKGSNWRPMVLTPTHTTSDSINYVGEMIETNPNSFGYSLPPTITAISNRRYWLITNTNQLITSNAFIQLYYGADDGVTDRNNLRVVQGIPNAWYNRGGTGTANGSGSITSSNFTSWGSLYTLSNTVGGTNALPITLLSFDAHNEKEFVELKWITESEINNDYFTVERSANGLDFVPIGVVNGIGTTTTTQYYSERDLYPLNGTSYYRLKQTDYDGTFSYAMPITVFRSGNKAVQVYPNPNAGDAINLSWSNVKGEVTIQIHDAIGQLMYEKRMVADENMSGVSINDIDEIKSGLYTLSIVNDQEKLSSKIKIN